MTARAYWLHRVAVNAVPKKIIEHKDTDARVFLYEIHGLTLDVHTRGQRVTDIFSTVRAANGKEHKRRLIASAPLYIALAGRTLDALEARK